MSVKCRYRFACWASHCFTSARIYIRFAIVPITEVGSPLSFALKIIATVLIANAIGITIYVLGKRK